MLRSVVEGKPLQERARPTVLVVDDDDSVCKLITRILTHARYSVVACTGFEQAEQQIRQGLNVGLLITDVVLDGSTGKRVASMVRMQHPNVPVLYISGYDNVQVGARVLPKPFTPQELLEAVQVLLEPAAAETSEHSGARAIHREMRPATT